MITTVGDKKYDHCRLKLMAQRGLEQKKIKDPQVKTRNRDEDRAPSRGKAKEMAK